MRLVILLCAVVLLVGCTLPSGENVILSTPEQHYNFYRNGSIDTCMKDARKHMKDTNVPLTGLNLYQAKALCSEEAEGLLHSHGVEAPFPVPIPQMAPAASRNGKL